MASAIIGAVINKIVDIIGDMIVENGSRLFWFGEDIKWLERQMRHMKVYLENAEAKTVTDLNVVCLIKDIMELLHDVEDFLDICDSKIGPHTSNGFLKRMSGCCKPFMSSREIMKIRRRIEDIDADRIRYGIEDISNTNDASNDADPRHTQLHVDDPVVIGFEEHIGELQSKLDSHPFVSIVGMGGVGKTTLAKKLFRGMKHDFDCAALVFVSQKPDITSLVRDMANQMDLQNEYQTENLQVSIHSYLQGVRYVILIDDIWDIATWDRLKPCFPINFENGSKIIITSRNSGVGRYIGGENSMYQLDPLDFQTSWELFSKLIYIPSLELETIGKEIVGKCAGIPLAIVIIVGILRERGMTEFSWNQVLHSIGQNANEKCSQILGLSYKDLPTSLKPCFLYFGTFREDNEVRSDEVIRLWMAENLIPRVGEVEPEDVGADYLMKLDSRNLIQEVQRGYDGRVEAFHIHDLLHDFCINMGMEIGLFNSIHHIKDSSAKEVRRLAFYGQNLMGNENKIYEMSKLRAIFDLQITSDAEFKRFNNMLGRFKLLHGLNLKLIFSDPLDKHITSSIGNLGRLKHLSIYSPLGYLEIPSSIQSLKLQTLMIAGDSSKLPIGILKMEQLRHLELQGSYKFYSGLKWPLWHYRHVEVCLPNLHTLAGISCRDLKPKWLFKFTNLKKLALNDVTPRIMNVLCGPEPLLEKLEILSCSSGDCTMTIGISLVKYHRLIELEIDGVSLQMQEPLELPPSLIKLTLYRTQLKEDPMKILKNLPKLTSIRLLPEAYFGSKMDCSGANNFPRLEILQLWGLPNLEELIEGEEMGMPQIRKISVFDCPELMRVPNWLQQFIKL